MTLRNFCVFISLTFLSLSACQSGQTKDGITTLDAKAFESKIKALDNEIIFDVRSPNEFVEGHITDALNVDWYGKYWSQVIAGMDTAKPYMLYCMSGSRSTDAAEAMKKAGFKTIYVLNGGTEAWIKAGLPLEKQ